MLPKDSFWKCSAYGFHTCGLQIDSTIKCWGANLTGELNAPAGQYTAITGAMGLRCGLRSDGTIKCWGVNWWEKSSILALTEEVTTITAGNTHVCGIRIDGTIKCWGHNGSGQLNAPAGQYTAIAAGGGQTCALRVDGTIKCWGHNGSGQLNAPAGQYTALATGGTHVCGLRVDGTIKCWGGNHQGQINAPAGQYIAITASEDSSCGLRTDQVVICWGSWQWPFTGEIDIHVFYCASPNWNYTDKDLRYEVERLNDSVSSFFASQSSGLVSIRFHPGGIVSPNVEWDNTDMGDLVDWQSHPEPCLENIMRPGNYESILVLVGLLPGYSENLGLNVAGFAAVEAAYSHTVDIFSTIGSCSASNRYQRARDYIDVACRDYTYLDYFQVVAHEIGHSVFLLSHPRDCSIMGIRYNPDICAYVTGFSPGIGCSSLIQLGWPDIHDRCSMERYGAPDVSFASITVGPHHSCGIRFDGEAQCWGSNRFGESKPPTGQFSSITTIGTHSCGLRTDGRVDCWGSVASPGRTPDPPQDQFTTLVGKVPSHLYDVINWYCGIRTDNTATCWGKNPGKQFTAPNGYFTSISVGLEHSCGLRTTGTVVCWGNNTEYLDVPNGQFEVLSAGSYHTCGLRHDDTVSCWGTSNSAVKTQAPTGQFSAVAAGQNHSCGLRKNGNISCWGYNNDGATDAPDGRFTAIAISHLDFTCGLQEDGAIQCWGRDVHPGDSSSSVMSVPSGRFVSVSAHEHRVCGLRDNGKAECWGRGSGRIHDPH